MRNAYDFTPAQRILALLRMIHINRDFATYDKNTIHVKIKVYLLYISECPIYKLHHVSIYETVFFNLNIMSPTPGFDRTDKLTDGERMGPLIGLTN